MGFFPVNIIKQYHSNIKTANVRSYRDTLMEVNRLYEVHLNKTFRTNFSSLLTMVAKEIKQHTFIGHQEYQWK